MSGLTETVLAGVGMEQALLVAVGVAGGYWLIRWKDRKRDAAMERRCGAIVESAKREAESILRESRMTASEESSEQRRQIEASFASKRQEFTEQEQRMARRESLINGQLEGVVSQEKAVRDREKQLQEQQGRLEILQAEVVEVMNQRKLELQKVSHLDESEARALLLKEVEQDALRDSTDLTRHILEAAKSKAEDQARRVLSLAIQRYAGTHTFETTTATVALQGDEIKGRIIGREGRNIRSFEAATGVTVLIDDTPNAVVLSGFDPVRREIAREAMQRLILDGRIHPTRIEEIVAAVSQEMDETLVQAGEDAFFRVNLTPTHPEVVMLLGRLRFRHSFSQNILDLSVEVSQLMGLMAAEIGIDINSAKRAGLLHDIGKAVNHEVEGSHAIVGAEIVKRCGESEDIVNGVASHHDEVPHTNLLGILVSAADAISASRPGARSESMSTYLKRLENLEQIGLSFPGVERCFAVQAGRELRVVVQPEQINDEQSFALARSVARKIEEELHYPGQIRVTVVRETRCVEFAK